MWGLRAGRRLGSRIFIAKSISDSVRTDGVASLCELLLSTILSVMLPYSSLAHSSCVPSHGADAAE